MREPINFNWERRKLFIALISVLAAMSTAGTVEAQEPWQLASGPFGGKIGPILMWGDTGIAIGTNIFRTTDGGQHWRNQFQASFVTGAIDPTGKGWIGSYYAGGTGRESALRDAQKAGASERDMSSLGLLMSASPQQQQKMQRSQR